MEYRLYTGDMYKYHLLWDNGTKRVVSNSLEECFKMNYTISPVMTWYDEDPICVVESYKDLEERYPELLI